MLTCKSCSGAFQDFAEDLVFRHRVAPEIGGIVFDFPAPARCPDCRRLARARYANDYRYYHRSCGLCSKRIISIYHSEVPHPVYCTHCWWSDRWSGRSYARELNLKRSMMGQFRDLREVVPQLAMVNDNGAQSENCEYCQNFAFGKNCYLVVGSWNDQDCLYCNESGYCRDVVDCDFVNLECELVYESNCCTHLYRCAFLSASTNCSECFFGYDLKGCKYCFGCIGLRNQSYCIFNKKVSPEEYRRFLAAEGDLGSHRNLEKLKTEIRSFFGQFPKRAVVQVGGDSCQGDGLFNCKNTLGYRLFLAEDCRYFYNGDAPKNCHHIDVSGKYEWCYECNSPDESYQCLFTHSTWRCRDSLYCDSCFSSHDLFGCVGLTHAEYCIFNKQYSKDDYFKLLPQVIERMREDEEWGEFFPEAHSFFCYNETRAQEIAPLDKELALQRGIMWRPLEEKVRSTSATPLPDEILACGGLSSKDIFSCIQCEQGYKILPQEVEFLKKMNIALPRICPSCRRRKRGSLRPTRLVERRCNDCSSEIQSVFDVNQEARVLCDRCADSVQY